MKSILATGLALLAFTTVVPAGTFHVATTGSDTNSGTEKAPFRTIQHAADLAQPGDVITVHQGIYRERVTPPRGGTADGKRITYQAAPGEKVEIKGSEVVTNWVRIQDNVWQAVIPNSFFGSFNPYCDLIHGDWFNRKTSLKFHTGEVYLNGDSLLEATNLSDVLKPLGSNALWCAVVDATNTTLWAQFNGVNPNAQLVEINVRQTVFYPAKPGINYLTVCGFALSQAATPWAPPTAEQIGLIGTHWSKGWVIESNTVSHSVCAGISLGKYGDEWDNRAESAEGYVGTINRALTNGWNETTIGHHLVRGNLISHCGQAGIVGSLGCAFSTITGNVIHDIDQPPLLLGAEMAGIKFHGAVDVEISHNHIYRCCRGIWLDWMAQGTRVSGNLLHANGPSEDLFVEVNHGPFLVDNNLFLSGASLSDWSQGGAYAHNLFAGKIIQNHPQSRQTPHHLPHSTRLVGLADIKGADDRFYNNLFVVANPTTNTPAAKERPHTISGFGLWVYDTCEFPLRTGGNVYLNGAQPGKYETNPLVLPDVDPKLKVVEKDGQTFLQFNFGSDLKRAATTTVTTALLGQAKLPNLPYKNADGSPLKIDRDYLGNHRHPQNPLPGPFENSKLGNSQLKLW